MYIGSAKTWFWYAYILCFHVCTYVCFHPISNVQIVRTLEKRIPIQTFEKCSLSNSCWHLPNADVIAEVKAKSLYHIGTFLSMWFFLPLQKFRTIKIKLEKNTYTQANMCLQHISRNFKDIFKYICFTLYL